MNFLKQSTARTLKLGPFVDETDFITDKTDLTIAQANIRLSKNGGDFGTTDDTAPSSSHDENAFYNIPLTTGDTDTLGILDVNIDVTGCLKVWATYQVVSANVYDSLIVTNSDYLQVDTVQIHSNDASSQLAADILQSDDFKALVSMAKGPIIKSGNSYTYYDSVDTTTALFTITIDTTSRTVS